MSSFVCIHLLSWLFLCVMFDYTFMFCIIQLCFCLVHAHIFSFLILVCWFYFSCLHDCSLCSTEPITEAWFLIYGAPHNDNGHDWFICTYTTRMIHRKYGKHITKKWAKEYFRYSVTNFVEAKKVETQWSVFFLDRQFKNRSIFTTPVPLKDYVMWRK